MRQKAQKLTSLQTYQLMTWLEQNRQQAEILPDPDLIPKIQASLKFLVTDQNIAHCRKQLDIKKNIPVADARKSRTKSAIEELVSRLVIAGTLNTADAGAILGHFQN